MLLVTNVDLYVLVRHPWLLMFEVEGNGPILLHGVPLNVGHACCSLDYGLKGWFWRTSPVRQITNALLELV